MRQELGSTPHGCGRAQQQQSSTPICILVGAGGPNEAKMAEVIQSERKKLGAEATVEKFKHLQQHDFDIAIAGWGGDYSNPYTFLGLMRPGNNFNCLGWSGAKINKYDQLVEQGLAAGMVEPYVSGI